MKGNEIREACRAHINGLTDEDGIFSNSGIRADLLLELIISLVCKHFEGEELEESYIILLEDHLPEEILSELELRQGKKTAGAEPDKTKDGYGMVFRSFYPFLKYFKASDHIIFIAIWSWICRWPGERPVSIDMINKMTGYESTTIKKAMKFLEPFGFWETTDFGSESSNRAYTVRDGTRTEFGARWKLRAAKWSKEDERFEYDWDYIEAYRNEEESKKGRSRRGNNFVFDRQTNRDSFGRFTKSTKSTLEGINA